MGTRPAAQEKALGSAKTLFVGNVDYDTPMGELKSFFSQFGNVASISVPQDFVTRHGRGFGFVTMSTREEAEYVKEQANGRAFRGRPLRLDWASYD
jgi:RNA recognition motif-containing protein